MVARPSGVQAVVPSFPQLLNSSLEQVNLCFQVLVLRLEAANLQGGMGGRKEREEREERDEKEGEERRR